MRKSIAILVTVAALFSGSVSVAPAQAQPSRSGSDITVTSGSVLDAIYYDLTNDSFGISAETARELGLSDAEIHRAAQNFSELSPEESRQLAEVIGLDLDFYKQQRQVVIFLGSVLAAVGAAAADEIIGQITNWGISGACRKLEGRWRAFDDFCRSNGHID